MRLRYAIDKARSFSVPKENIRRSIKKATGELGAENFVEVVYEGYGPGGVAVLCEALTDNRNRTASELRRLFEAAGGNLGASGCVGYLFNFKGLFVIDAKHIAEDRLMEIALEAGAEDVELVNGYFEVTCDPKFFEIVREADRRSRIPTESAETSYLPTNYVNLDVENGKKCASSENCSKKTTTSRTSTLMTTFPRNNPEMGTTPLAKSERLRKLPPYLFAEIDKKKKAALAAGRDVINLGVGDPDQPDAG